MSTKNPYAQFMHNDYFTHHFYHKKKVEEPVINEIVDVYGPILKPAGVIIGKVGFVFFFNVIQQLFFGIFALFSMFIFPFYYRVFQKNRGNDKNLPIFPILSHFYRIVCFQLFCWFNGFVVTQTLMFFQIPCESLAQILVLLPGYVAPVFNILITVLALQRFLIYFFPESENYVNFKKRTWNFIILILYALILALNVGFGYAKYNLNQENFKMYEIFMPNNTSESIDAFDTIIMVRFRNLENSEIQKSASRNSTST
ncbi:Protein CBR-SRZ-6 [Caenorhabditis briggsae]|uniref:Protein CBR-SRZ-6 n=1 Tax=Caenorhabditis briggsae TaxID=6238 RepID=A8WJX7_CAEBR|nr:Protein CBR-SRZ-6 [Caenorhabditis briggsae]CAP20770.2 Protein CBR-SRZ-6 [Caenorhabditis briggsae]